MSIQGPDYQPTPPPPYYPAAQTPENYPGKGLGLAAMIVSLVGMFFPTALIGAIMGHVALSQSKRAGFKNGFALAGIIVGWALFGLFFLVFALAMTLGVLAGISEASYM